MSRQNAMKKMNTMKYLPKKDAIPTRKKEKNQRNQNNNFPNEEEKQLTLNALGLPLGTPEEMAEIFLTVQRLYSKDTGRRIRHESLHLTFDEAMDRTGQNQALETNF